MENETERELTPQEKLDNLNEERKSLKAQISTEKENRLKNASKFRAEREVKLKKDSIKLHEVQAKIYAYNKTGAASRIKIDIFGEIIAIIQSEVYVGTDLGIEDASESPEKYNG